MADRLPFSALRSAILAAATLLLVAACTSAGTAAPSGSDAGASAAALTSPAESVAPSTGPSAKPSPSPKITQTDTPWGRIWDAVPASFPVPAGAEPTTPDRAASGAWSLSSGDPAAVTDDLRAGLERIGLTTDGVSGPLEDGSRIIDSVGKPSACRVQTRVTPQGSTIIIVVMFGASCPFR